MTLKHAIPFALLACGAVHAAENFEPRYNMAGSLGGEIFAPPDQTGWAVGFATTNVPVRKVTGGGNGGPTLPVAGGTVPVPGLPGALAPSYGPGQASIEGNGTMSRQDLAIGYLTPEQYGGGRLLFLLDLPFARKNQYISAHGATPALNWPAGTPPQLHDAVGAQFDQQYQAGVATQGRAASGHVVGVGDAEVIAGWQYIGEQWRLLATTALALPTGKYNADPAPDIGVGNFRTLRPALQLGYLPTPDWALAAKFSVGLNARNHDNQLRSGNWAGIEMAAGYKSPIGVFGLHGLRVQQYQDDDQNPLGSSRFSSTNAGAFYTARLPGVGSIVTLQYMDTTASHNAKHGRFTQLRVIQLF